MKLKDFESPELTDADSIVEMVDEGVDDAVGVMVMMSLSSSLRIFCNLYYRARVTGLERRR